MKKLKTALMCVTVAALAVVTAACGNNDKSRSTKEDKPDYALSYSYDGRGTYTVSGFSADYIDGAKERGEDVSTLEIPSSYLGKPVAAIADGAFRDCDFLYEVKIPDSIDHIGSYAFYDCSQLRMLEMGNGVSSIAGSAFGGCESLGVVLYWGSVADWCGITFADPAANPVSTSADFFIDGARASSVRVPTGVTRIKPYAFYGCGALRSVSFSDDLKYIDTAAFANCTALGEASLGGTSSIGERAFMNTALKSITLPATLEHIGTDAFKYCRFLYEVYDNARLGVSIGGDGFGGVGMYALDIREADEPSGIKRNGEYVFYRSSSTEKTYLVGVPYADLKPILPTTDTPYAVAPSLFAGAPIVTVTLSPSVTEIGDYAFAGCSRLVEITVCKELEAFGEGAFLDDTALKAVNYNGTKEQFEAIEYVAQAGEPSCDPRFYGATLYIVATNPQLR